MTWYVDKKVGGRRIGKERGSRGSRRELRGKCCVGGVGVVKYITYLYDTVKEYIWIFFKSWRHRKSWHSYRKAPRSSTRRRQLYTQGIWGINICFQGRVSPRHIVAKTSRLQNKEIILRATRENCQLTKVNPWDFAAEILKPKTIWKNTLRTLKVNSC